MLIGIKKCEIVKKEYMNSNLHYCVPFPPLTNKASIKEPMLLKSVRIT